MGRIGLLGWWHVLPTYFVCAWNLVISLLGFQLATQQPPTWMMHIFRLAKGFIDGALEGRAQIDSGYGLIIFIWIRGLRGERKEESEESEGSEGSEGK